MVTAFDLAKLDSTMQIMLSDYKINEEITLRQAFHLADSNTIMLAEPYFKNSGTAVPKALAKITLKYLKLTEQTKKFESDVKILNNISNGNIRQSRAINEVYLDYCEKESNTFFRNKYYEEAILSICYGIYRKKVSSDSIKDCILQFNTYLDLGLKAHGLENDLIKEVESYFQSEYFDYLVSNKYKTEVRLQAQEELKGKPKEELEKMLEGLNKKMNTHKLECRANEWELTENTLQSAEIVHHHKNIEKTLTDMLAQM